MFSSYLNLDTAIIVLYLLFTLLIGIYFGANNKSIREYAVGNRDFSDTALFCTIIATAISGSSIMFITSEVYQYGIVATCVFFSLVLGDLFRSWFVAPQFRRYLRNKLISAGEMMSLDYGKPGQVLTGLCSFLIGAGYLAMQLKVAGIVFSFSLNIDANFATYICGVIVILYASFGGIRSVVFTDVLQLTTIALSLPLIANIGLSEIDGYSGLFKAIPSEKLTFNAISLQTKYDYISLFIMFSIPFFTGPVDYQRMLMARHTFQIKDTFRYSAYLMFGYVFFASIIAFLAIVFNSEIESNKVFYYMVENYMPPGLKGIALVGVIAMAMSTADSIINNTGVALINDVLKPLKIVNSTEGNELFYTKLSSFLISIIALYAASNSEDIVSILLKMSLFWAPVVAPALFMNLFGFKTSVSNLFLAAFFGVSSTFIWESYDLSSNFIINKLIAGTIVNLVSLVFFDILFSPSEDITETKQPE